MARLIPALALPPTLWLKHPSSERLWLCPDLIHAAGGGPVANVGCGPGRITAHLHELGVDAFGMDLRPG
jgi:hypothetical protein